MKSMKYIALLLATIWSASVWQSYFDKKDMARSVVVVTKGGSFDIDMAYAQDDPLSDDFWQWEAEGKLNLVDTIIDDPELMSARHGQKRNKDELKSIAENLVFKQMQAYQVNNLLEAPNIVYTPLRGDANGLYVPFDKTIYLNSKMQWDELNFERFAEVILHENMHHIMTHMYGVIHDNHILKRDFEKLAMAAAMAPYHLANDNHEVDVVNIQELVAYKTQRVARYAGLDAGDLSVWEISARMQEIRVMTVDAGLTAN